MRVAKHLTIDDVDSALSQHNTARASVREYADIRKMSWNTSIATISKSYASRCHFKPSGRTGLGENLYAAYGFTPTWNDIVINSWVSK